jgi:ketosteroid isomerase-like protein
MSAEEIDVVLRFREAVAASDEASAIACLADDVEWVHPKGTMRGIDEVRAGYLGSGSPSGPENLDVEADLGELQSLGDGRVAAINHHRFRWKETGDLAYERRARIEYFIREGKIVRYEAILLDD